MDTKLFRQQYEYECICGHIWIDSENNGCPMCGELSKVTATEYTSKPPEDFATHYKK